MIFNRMACMAWHGMLLHVLQGLYVSSVASATDVLMSGPCMI